MNQVNFPRDFSWLLLMMAPSFSPPYIIFCREILKYVYFLMYLLQAVLQRDQLLLKIFVLHFKSTFSFTEGGACATPEGANSVLIFRPILSWVSLKFKMCCAS